MNRDTLRSKCDQLVADLSGRFADGETIDLDGIIFLVGVQELGQGFRTFKKDEKVNLMHIAICRLLEPYGYYRYLNRDSEGWPHYELTEYLPNLRAGEQSILMKEALVKYFEELSSPESQDQLS